MAGVKIFTVEEPFLDHSCGLGEGPFYEDYSNKLRFVDIVNKQLHYIDISIGPASHRVIQLDQAMTLTIDIQGDKDRFLFVGKHCLGLFNKSTEKYEVVHELWSDQEIQEGKNKSVRGNDGKCDQQGRLWFGVMSDPTVKNIEREGTFFRFDPDGQLHKIFEPVTIPNGISWSNDHKIMYWTDTGDSSIYAFDFDETRGTLSNKRTFFKPEEGSPDGHARDTEEHIWVALFGAGKVVRVSPEGQVVAEIHLPTRSVTCPVFAGEELFITTAAEEEPDKFPESVKHQGKLFKCHVGQTGAPVYQFPYSHRA